MTGNVVSFAGYKVGDTVTTGAATGKIVAFTFLTGIGMTVSIATAPGYGVTVPVGAAWKAAA